jgi:hypothetical protein
MNQWLRTVAFSDSRSYWELRYARGGNSGAGSLGCLAEFKARILNDFVREHSIASIVEFGCGDGHQLSLADYPQYLGVDVSAAAIERCLKQFAHDPRKTFLLAGASNDPSASLKGDLTLSLDVIYHIVEDDVFRRYMAQLFDAARRYVIVYSSNFDSVPPVPHVRHRKFTTWVDAYRPAWRLVRHVPNEFPFDPRRSDETSWADFFVFAQTD